MRPWWPCALPLLAVLAWVPPSGAQATTFGTYQLDLDPTALEWESTGVRTLQVAVTGQIQCPLGTPPQPLQVQANDTFQTDSEGKLLWRLDPGAFTADWAPLDQSPFLYSLDHTETVSVVTETLPSRELWANVTWFGTYAPEGTECSPGGYQIDGVPAEFSIHVVALGSEPSAGGAVEGGKGELRPQPSVEPWAAQSAFALVLVLVAAPFVAVAWGRLRQR